MCQFLVSKKKEKCHATAANNKTTLLGGFLLSFPLRSRQRIIADGQRTRQGMRKKEKVVVLFSTWTIRKGSKGKKNARPFFPSWGQKSVSRTSRKLRNPSAFKCDWWTKISSLPSSGMINPNPLLALNHLTVFYFILESQERDRREKEDDVSDRSDF